MSHTDQFSEKAATWDDDPGNVARAHAVAALVRDAVPLQADTRALEIGAGTGLLARALADDLGSVTVTDVAPGMVAAASAALSDPRYRGWEARRFDIEQDPVLSERYDLILGLLTLHHMRDIGAVLRRCADLLKPGGWVAMTDLDHDPQGDFHASVHDFHGHDGFTREAVHTWLTEAGFIDVSLADAGSVTKEIDNQSREFPMFLAVARLPG